MQDKIDSAGTRLTDFLRGHCLESLEEILDGVAGDLDLRHISYLRFASGSDRRIVNMVVTYPYSWQIRYSERSYFLIDPRVTTGCRSVMPFDWDELRTGESRITAFFKDAVSHDIGRNGISLPVRNRDGKFSLVSFTSDHSKDKWRKYKRENMTILQSVATLIDLAASFTKKVPQFPVTISEMENKCLNLFARSRNVNDIADAVKITTSEVTLYLETARHKLHAISITHAVTVANVTEAIYYDK